MNSKEELAQKRAEFAEGFSSGEDRSQAMIGYDEGVKACTAIKDAEIAELLFQTDIERGDLITELYKEIAALELSVKELREALTGLMPLLDSYGDYSDIHEILAKTEHHNSRAMEKMLLEAEIYGLCNTEREFNLARLEYCKAKLAELNKE